MHCFHFQFRWKWITHATREFMDTIFGWQRCGTRQEVWITLLWLFQLLCCLPFGCVLVKAEHQKCNNWVGNCVLSCRRTNVTCFENNSNKNFWRIPFNSWTQCGVIDAFSSFTTCQRKNDPVKFINQAWHQQKQWERFSRRHFIGSLKFCCGHRNKVDDVRV